MKIKALGLLAIAGTFTLAGCVVTTKGEHFKFDKEQVVDNLIELQKTGFEITFSALQDDDLKIGTIGAKQGEYWLQSEDEGVAVRQGELEYDIFEYDKEKTGYIYDKSITDDNEFRDYLNEIFAWLTYATEYDGNVKKTGTKTLVGRQCTEYVYENVLTTFVKAQLDMTFLIDDDTGITLSADVEISDEEDKSHVTFEATKFLLGDDVNAPELVKD